MKVSDAVILRCQDLDENVRLEVLTMVQGLAKRKFEALSERLLTHVIDRIRDKKVGSSLQIKFSRFRHSYHYVILICAFYIFYVIFVALIFY